MKSVLSSLRGILLALLLLTYTVVVAASIIVFGLLVRAIPCQKGRKLGLDGLVKLPVWWTQLNGWILGLGVRNRWKVQGEAPLSSKNWYVMVSNHRSWLDILVMGYLFGGRLPIMKFFMKQELLWTLPLAGVACWVLNFPFMKRHTREDIRKNPALKGQDIKTAQEACQKLRSQPAALLSYVEGTRFTEVKRDHQQSPYQNLLKPKGGGLAVSLHELHDCLSGLLNITIYYADADISLWKFLCGRFTKINCHYELLPIQPEMVGDYYADRKFRAHFQQWLNELWEQKDQRISSWSKE